MVEDGSIASRSLELSFSSERKYDVRKIREDSWQAFQKYAIVQGDLPLDGCSLGLPYDYILDAVQFIAFSVSKAHVENIMNHMQLRKGDTIPWAEFKLLVSYHKSSLLLPVSSLVFNFLFLIQLNS